MFHILKENYINTVRTRNFQFSPNHMMAVYLCGFPLGVTNRKFCE